MTPQEGHLYLGMRKLYSESCAWCSITYTSPGALTSKSSGGAMMRMSMGVWICVLCMCVCTCVCDVGVVLRGRLAAVLVGEWTGQARMKTTCSPDCMLWS